MQIRHYFYALVVTFCWGANFVASVKGLEHFSPFFMLSLRFFAVGLILLPFYWRRSIRWTFVSQMAFVLGTLHFGGVFGAMAYGIDIPTAVITVQLGVPFSCMLSAMLFKDRLGPWRTGGLVVAFLGMILIAGTPNVVQHFIPFLMVMAAAFCWAVSNVMMKREGAVNVMELICWQSLVSSGMLLLVSLIFEQNQWHQLITVPPLVVLALSFSALVSTIIAYGLWYHLLNHCDVSRIAPFNLLVPVFGIGVGQIFYPKELDAKIIIGSLITLVGVAIIVMRRPKLAEWGFMRKVRKPRKT